MIKFIDKAFVRGQLFTYGMIAQFDDITEAKLIEDGDAVVYVVEVGGTIENAVYAESAGTAQNAVNAQSAVTAQSATTAQSALTADTATTAATATTATTAATATTALTADHASTADTASTAGHATTATSASSATIADSSTLAEKASSVLLPTNIPTFPELIRPIESIASYAGAISASVTGADEQLEIIVIAAGTLGLNSILQFEPVWSFTNSVNNKTMKLRVGGQTIYSVTRTSSVREAPLIILANRNSLKSQIAPYDGNYTTASATAVATYAIDFTVDVIVEFVGNRASSGDSLKLEYYRILHTLG